MKEKTLWATTLLLAAMLTIPMPTRSQPESMEARRINVSGEAEIRVAPDEVNLTLGVEILARELLNAKDQADARMERALNLIDGYGIPANRVQTDHVSIQPRRDIDGGIEGFYVRETLMVTLRGHELALFEALLTDLLQAGVNYIHGIQFRTTDLRAHRDQARALALEAAREKAQDMAQVLDESIGEPLNIHEDYIGWWSGYAGWWGSYYGGPMTQNVIQEISGSVGSAEGLAPGQISVTARVSVTFELR
jgi:uncharacterized protein YggE